MTWSTDVALLVVKPLINQRHLCAVVCSNLQNWLFLLLCTFYYYFFSFHTTFHKHAWKEQSLSSFSSGQTSSWFCMGHNTVKTRFLSQTNSFRVFPWSSRLMKINASLFNLSLYKFNLFNTILNYNLLGCSYEGLNTNYSEKQFIENLKPNNNFKLGMLSPSCRQNKNPASWHKHYWGESDAANKHSWTLKKSLQVDLMCNEWPLGRRQKSQISSSMNLYSSQHFYFND